MFYDDFGTEMEAIETERRDADMEMAEMNAIGDRIAAAQRRGICTHGSAVAYRNPPAYPAQHGLTPGQLRCTSGCGRLFASDDDWDQAMDDAIN